MPYTELVLQFLAVIALWFIVICLTQMETALSASRRLLDTIACDLQRMRKP